MDDIISVIDLLDWLKKINYTHYHLGLEGDTFYVTLYVNKGELRYQILESLVEDQYTKLISELKDNKK